MSKNVKLNPRFQAIKEHLYSDLKDEAVILSMETGKYYGLNAVGVSIWKTIQEPSSLETIESAVMREYEVDQTLCRREVQNFLEEMANEKLIRILDEQAP